MADSLVCTCICANLDAHHINNDKGKSMLETTHNDLKDCGEKNSVQMKNHESISFSLYSNDDKVERYKNGQKEFESCKSDELDSLVESINNEVKDLPRTEFIKNKYYYNDELAKDSNRYLIFSAGNLNFALASNYILEISRVPYITPVPNVPKWLLGVVNIRGEITSAISLSIYLNQENIQLITNKRMIVVRIEKSKFSTCLIVDQISTFFYLFDANILSSHVSIYDKMQPYLKDIRNYRNQMVAIIDLEKFLMSQEIQQLE